MLKKKACSQKYIEVDLQFEDCAKLINEIEGKKFFENMKTEGKVI